MSVRKNMDKYFKLQFQFSVPYILYQFISLLYDRTPLHHSITASPHMVAGVELSVVENLLHVLNIK